MSDFEEELPHNSDAEMGVVGAVLIDPDVYALLRATLKMNDFYIVRLGYVWDAYGRVMDSGQKIDTLTVSNALRVAGQLEDVGGDAFLTYLLNQVPSSLHAEGYAEIVLDYSLRRKLLFASRKITTVAYSADSGQAALEESTKAMGDVLSGVAPDQGEISARDAISAHYDQIRSPAAPTLPTPWGNVNKMLDGGLSAGLHVFAGRPGTGKSTLLLNIASYACQREKRGAFFSLEMPNEQNMDRLVSLVSGIPHSRIKSHALLESDDPAYLRAVSQIGKYPLTLVYNPGLTPETLYAACSRMSAHAPLDFIVVDYLQLVHAAGFKNDNRVQEVTFITRYLKRLSGEMGIPVLVAAQLNREVEHRASRRPQLSDLRESGSTEQDADSVIFLWTDDDAPKGGSDPILLTASIAKQRSGPQGDATLIFKAEIMDIRAPAAMGRE